jgi:glycosyltransferase involved in cell wall biosynthesis
MKFVFLIAALNAGGAERVMTTLANSMVNKNHNITIITFNDGSSFYHLDPRVKVVGLNIEMHKNRFLRLVTTPIKEYQRLYNIKKAIKNEKPNLILSFCFTANVFNILLKRKFRKIPVVVSERNDPNSYSKMIQFLCKYLYSYADCIVCQSEMVKQYYTNRNDIVIIPNPINKNAIMAQQVHERTKRVVAVGRLVPQKNFNLLIEAFQLIEKEFQDYTVEIYGDGPLKNELQHKINGLGLQNRIKLMGIKKDIMKSIYDATVFVMSSNFEGFPNVLVESMASGLPVISTNFASGIARELIKDNENGYVVSVGNKIELSEAIKKVIANRTLQEKMSINNRSVLEKLEMKKISDEWENMFFNIIKKS